MTATHPSFSSSVSSSLPPPPASSSSSSSGGEPRGSRQFFDVFRSCWASRGVLVATAGFQFKFWSKRTPGWAPRPIFDSWIQTSDVVISSMQNFRRSRPAEAFNGPQDHQTSAQDEKQALKKLSGPRGTARDTALKKTRHRNSGCNVVGVSVEERRATDDDDGRRRRSRRGRGVEEQQQEQEEGASIPPKSRKMRKREHKKRRRRTTTTIIGVLPHRGRPARPLAAAPAAPRRGWRAAPPQPLARRP